MVGRKTWNFGIDYKHELQFDHLITFFIYIYIRNTIKLFGILFIVCINLNIN